MACVGIEACRDAAIGSGSIAGITNACNGDRACSFAVSLYIGGANPSPPDNGSSIGGVGIYKACNADEACSDLAKVQTKNCTGPQFPPFCPKFRNCTEGAQQVAPFCPSYCPIDIRFSNLTAYEGCLETYGCFPSLFGPGNCYNCTGLQEDPFCPLDYNCTGPLVYPRCPPINPPIYFDIADGLNSCCNHPMKCKGDKTEEDLPDDCSMPADLPSKANKKKNKDKKNAPWKKGKGGD